jgi:hypothetical protein
VTAPDGKVVHDTLFARFVRLGEAAGVRRSCSTPHGTPTPNSRCPTVCGPTWCPATSATRAAWGSPWTSTRTPTEAHHEAASIIRDVLDGGPEADDAAAT